MPRQQNRGESEAGDAVMEAVGKLKAATADLKVQTARKDDVSLEDVVNVLRSIGHAFIKIFGKETR